MNLPAAQPISRPLLTTVDGVPLADTRDVATAFEKNHRDVLRAVDNLLAAEPSLALRTFAQGSYTRPETGSQSHRRFLMNRDGFSLLAMGFTGPKALTWKLRFIEAFNGMEAELRGRSSRIDVRDPAQLATIAGQLLDLTRELEARAVAAEQAVALAQPKAAFFDRFANADGLYGLQNAARALGQPPQGFIDRLKGDVLFYAGGALVPKAAFTGQGYFVVRPILNGERARHQTFVTAKGLQWLAERFAPPALPPARPGDLFTAGPSP